MNKIRLITFGACLPVLGFLSYVRIQQPIQWKSIGSQTTCIDTSKLGPYAKQRKVREIWSYQVRIVEWGPDHYCIEWNDDLNDNTNVSIVCKE
jgi:hypothetical protein